jgi:nitroreductase
MQQIAPSALLSAQQWRYATKQFDASKKIPADVWSVLEQALVLSPSSFGLQPWRFVMVSDPATRAKLREHSWGQSQVTDASHLVVFAARHTLDADDITRFIRRTAEVRGQPPEALKGYQDMMNGSLLSRPPAALQAWAERQVYLAFGNLMTSAALLGIDTCPLEGLDPAKYDEILGLPALGFRTVAACAVGYRAASDKYATAPKVRFPADELILRR